MTHNHHDKDLAYMASLSAAVLQRSPRFLLVVVLLIFVFFAVAIGWLSWAEIDVVIRGSGKVIPAGQVQVVQSLEGGIVSEILIKEGQLVKKDQPLIKISDIAFTSSFEENKLSYHELRAKSARLKAEAFNLDFEEDPEVKAESPRVMASERNLFDSNRQQLEDNLSILNEQMTQQGHKLNEVQSNKRQLTKKLRLMRKEIYIKKPLLKKGIISEIEYLQLQQRESEIEGELEGITLSIPRTQSTIDEARLNIGKARLDFQNKAKKELNEVSAEISRIAEAQTALKDRVTRTILRSPVNGIVKQLHSNTIGGVVTPGSDILEIVPRDDSLLVEVRIKPSDIANLEHGQTARLKFSAYDFAIYGSIKGLVSFISADTITNEEGDSYFLVRIRPEKTYLGHRTKPLSIKIGMNSEADILTDKKTILEYLLKPINRGLQRALREN